ncbi:PPM-type phosphatase domain-containing protein [Plasmodiophora brassicae]|uniref:PPM-type phosphatase domain-containing protein n=1 Tax=Plasmodiophora brassicae TaxID=37360 RepID=A0A0G4IQ54_PLABS|nr:hypothetical protein PBRA_000688 [Plasmodiophora brassicae]
MALRTASARCRRRIGARAASNDPRFPTCGVCHWEGQTAIGPTAVHAHAILAPSTTRQDYCDVILDLAEHVSDGRRRAMLTSTGQFPPYAATDDAYWDDVASRVQQRHGRVAWFAVYDGHDSGTIAQLAAQYLPYVLARAMVEQTADLDDLMRRVPREVHDIIKRQALEGKGMDVRDAGGTTATMAIVADGHVHVCAVGDSPAAIHTKSGVHVVATQTMSALPSIVEAEFKLAGMPYSNDKQRPYDRHGMLGPDQRVGIPGLKMYGSIGDFFCDLDAANALVHVMCDKYTEADLKIVKSLTRDRRAWSNWQTNGRPFVPMTGGAFRRAPDEVVSEPLTNVRSVTLVTSGARKTLKGHEQLIEFIDSAPPGDHKQHSLAMLFFPDDPLSVDHIDDSTAIYIDLNNATRP